MEDHPAEIHNCGGGLLVRLGLDQSGNPVAFFPLAPLREECNTLETLENVAALFT
jgi:hypothetical protein